MGRGLKLLCDMCGEELDAQDKCDGQTTCWRCWDACDIDDDEYNVSNREKEWWWEHIH